MMGRWRSMVGLGILAAGLGAVAGCDQPTPQERGIRQGSESYLFTISADQMPPRAMEWINYTVVVRDRKTRQPIQAGEGQFYAGHPQGPKAWDGMVYGPEIGTYHGRMRFIVSGLWSVNLRFRRDSLAAFEKSEWMQDVIEGLPYGDTLPPPAKKTGRASTPP
jgi:hypothetical protein